MHADPTNATLLNPGQANQVWAFGNSVDKASEGRDACDWPHQVALQLLAAPLESALPVVLEMLGRLGDADRVYVLEYNEELTCFRNTHEWTRLGVRRYVEDLQNAPVVLLGGLHREMLAGHALAVTDVMDMPRDMRDLQAEFQRQGNKGVLCLPLYFEGRLRGLFGFDVTRARQTWSAAVVTAMRQCADLLGRALHGPTNVLSSHAPFPAFVYLSNGSYVRGVPLVSVVALRAQRNCSKLYLDDGTILTDGRALKQWQILLPSPQFVRLHRGAIIRVVSIRELVRRPSGRWHVTIANSTEEWNVSREALADLRKSLGA